MPWGEGGGVPSPQPAPGVSDGQLFWLGAGLINYLCARCRTDDRVGLFSDERDAIQKKTFTKWVNKHLKKVSVPPARSR